MTVKQKRRSQTKTISLSPKAAEAIEAIAREDFGGNVSAAISYLIVTAKT